MLTTTASHASPALASDTSGIVLVATGDRRLSELRTATAGSRAVRPAFPALVFTDEAPFVSDPHTSVSLLAKPPHTTGEKIQAILDAPLDRFLFLGTDAHVVEPFAPFSGTSTILGLRRLFSPHTAMREARS